MQTLDKTYNKIHIIVRALNYKMDIFHKAEFQINDLNVYIEDFKGIFIVKSEGKIIFNEKGLDFINSNDLFISIQYVIENILKTNILKFKNVF